MIFPTLLRQSCYIFLLSFFIHNQAQPRLHQYYRAMMYTAFIVYATDKCYNKCDDFYELDSLCAGCFLGFMQKEFCWDQPEHVREQLYQYLHTLTASSASCGLYLMSQYLETWNMRILMYLIIRTYIHFVIKKSRNIPPSYPLNIVRSPLSNQWQEMRPMYEQSGLRHRILSNSQQAQEKRARIEQHDPQSFPQQREALDIAGEQDSLPFFHNRGMVEELLKNIMHNPIILNPVTRNPITLNQRSLSAALTYWQKRGISIEKIIERVLEVDPTTYETHTVDREEAYALGDSLGLAPQEIEHILTMFPQKFIEIADLVEAMSIEPLKDSLPAAVDVSLFVPAPGIQSMQ